MRSTRRLCIAMLLCFAAISAQGQSSTENSDFKLALNLYNDGMFELAAEQLKQFVAAFPSTAQGVEARFYLGLARLKLKQYDEARLAFQTFALTYQDNPKAPEAWRNVGESYAAMNNHKEAALAYERVKVFHPKSPTSPDALVMAAKQFTLAGLNDDARRVLRIVLQEYPSTPAAQDARAELGHLYFVEGNLVQAEQELERVIEGDPSQEARSQALLVLGDIYFAQWRMEQARTCYEEIITKHKASAIRAVARVRIGNVLMALGKFGDAAESYSKALSEKSLLDSNSVVEAGVALGNAYAAMNDHTKAIRQYELALGDVRPGHPFETDLLNRIAVEEEKGGNHTRATRALQRILLLSPDGDVRRRTLVHLAIAAENGGNPGEAVRLYGMFLEAFPNDPAAPEVLQKSAELSNRQLKDPRRAGLLCEMLISRFSSSPQVITAYLRAADCYEQLKDFRRSIELRHELLRAYPAADSAEFVEAHTRVLETFEAKDKDAALEKLALLLGDVFAERSRGDLAFTLGEVYFKDLKNFTAAAEQFTAVINSGLTGARFEDALFFRSKSYEYLSWRDPSYRAPAIESYTTFVNSYASDPRSDEAYLSLFRLKATSVREAIVAYDGIRSARPQTPGRDEMLLRTGMLQEASDTSAAMATYATVLREHATSRSAIDAGYRRFAIFLRREHSDSAAVEGKRFVSRYPNSRHTAQVLAGLGEIAHRSSSFADAAEYFSTLREQFAYTAAAENIGPKLASAYAAGGKNDEAMRVLDGLIEEEKSDPFGSGQPRGELLLEQARLKRLSGHPVAAREIVFQLLAHERPGPLTGEAYSLLGRIANDEGNAELATAYFQQAGTASPGSTSTREVADLLFASGAYGDAARQYTLLAASAKEENEKLYCEARTIVAVLRSDDMERAQKEIGGFTKAHKGSDDHLATFELEKGNLFFRKGEYKSASAAYKVVLDKYDETPSVPEALYWSGKILETNSKSAEAAKLYTEILADYPAASILPRVRLALGNISYQAEQWDEAIRYFKSVAEDPHADPKLLPFATSNLIETYEAAGFFDAALDWTRKYLDRFPSSDDAFDKRIKIGILYQRLGYHEQSLVHLQGLLDEAGSELEGEIRYYIAEANFQKGDYQQAILDFLKVPYLVTKKGEIDWTANSFYMAGQSYERLGRHDQALAMYQQIVDRPGIDQTFKAAAAKEIDRVKLVLKKGN